MWNKRHSPSDIEVMLHYYACCEPHPRWHAPAVQDAVTRFLKEGLLQMQPIYGYYNFNRSGYEATPKGKAWVEMICDTPYPKQIWIDPRTIETDTKI